MVKNKKLKINTRKVQLKNSGVQRYKNEKV